jgi:hypothetical protein
MVRCLIFAVLELTLLCSICSWKIEQGIPTTTQRNGFVSEYIQLKDIHDESFEALIMYPFTFDSRDEDMTIFLPNDRKLKGFRLDQDLEKILDIKLITDTVVSAPTLRGSRKS